MNKSESVDAWASRPMPSRSAARTGLDPHTGVAAAIAATAGTKFTASGALTGELNRKRT
jgi:nucleoid DNA-binding protein